MDGDFPPCALLNRTAITVRLFPSELYTLIRELEARALMAANHADTAEYADYLFCRIAELREAMR
jgi:hypothetical protein